MATINICDVCGSRDDVARRSYWVDRRMDAAESMSDEHEVYDLCPKCELKIMRRAVYQLGKDIGKGNEERVIGTLLNDLVRLATKGNE